MFYVFICLLFITYLFSVHVFFVCLIFSLAVFYHGRELNFFLSNIFFRVNIVHRDRTAQLTSLSQLMIDPYYRTIEGFLTLMQKEWCSFGHKFEDRLGTRRSHHKEVSPVCLQFLDCVWQLQRQFPTAFEYSGQFVTFISQCMYSGLFLNFRRNSERDRSQLMRNVGPFEDMQTDDFDFSTLSGYTNLLLRTSNQAALMLNSSYVPPKPSQKNVRVLLYSIFSRFCQL